MNGISGALVAGLLLLAAGPSAACGVESDCAVEGGTYRLALPDEGASAAPAILFLHGYAASAAAPMRWMAGEVTARGWALIAPNGQPDPLQPANLDWDVADGADQPRDDPAFLGRVIADAAARGVDPARLVVAGYSRGGSMTWDLACTRPRMAAGFAAVAGVFWEPRPRACAGPVHLLHQHGTSDSLMPVAGRSLDWFGETFLVASLEDSLAVMRRTMGCPGPSTERREGPARVERWAGCDAGSITLVLTPGGHGRDADWPGRLLDWAEALPGITPP